MATLRNQDSDESEIYFQKFDYDQHKETFDADVDSLSDFIKRCSDSSDIRHCQWEGKSSDLKKSGETAFPFQGASDTEVHLAEFHIASQVAINENALRKSTIKAYPRTIKDVARSAEVTAFMRWLRDAGIKDFWQQMEKADNYAQEKSLRVAYCDYRSPTKRSYEKIFDLEEIQKSFPDQADDYIEILADEDRVEEALEVFNSIPGWEINEKRVKKALKQLRKEGVANIPVTIEDQGYPVLQVLSPDEEFFAPSYTTNFNEAVRCHIRKPMTSQEILSRVSSEGWDMEWAEWAVENERGTLNAFRTSSTIPNPRQPTSCDEDRDLIDVVFTFERLIDRDDLAEGIYLTVWSPEFGDNDGQVPPFAKRTLLSGLRQLPFIVQSRSYDARTLYSAPTVPELLKASQKNQKVLRDANMDNSAYEVSPSLLAPPTWDHGRPGPGGVYATRTGQAPSYLQRNTNFGAVFNLEKEIVSEADRLVGHDPQDPISQEMQRASINRHLSFAQDVLKLVYEMYKLKGPDELFFRITGRPEPVQFVKNADETEMDVCVSFNTMYDDPEKMEKMSRTIIQAAQLDTSGRVNNEAVVDFLLTMADPMAAETILLPAEVGTDKIKNETLSDIAQMSAGIARAPAANAAELRMQVVTEYEGEQQQIQQSGQVESILLSNPQFVFLLGQYKKQLEMAIMQKKNGSEFGIYGTEAASVGNMSTQNLEGGQ
jgi:hypothetical protein